MRIRKEHIIENDIEKKHCSTCDTWKCLSDYNVHSNRWDKLSAICRKCHTDCKKGINAGTKVINTGTKKEHRFENNIEQKHCPTCDTWKCLNEYNSNKSRWDKLHSMCGQCTRDYKNAKRKNDPAYREKDRLYNEKYKSSGRRKEVSDIRYENKREEIIKKCTEYNKKKYKEDPYFRAVFLLRTRIGKVLRDRNLGKQDKTYDLLGCSKSEFIKYFENKFTENMTWEKVGNEIHIDHIKPCCSFNLTTEEEQKKCFHYTNLQPLWASDNLSKGGKH